MPRLLIILVSALLFTLPHALVADDGGTLLNLTAHAEREVDNDLMTVNLSAERRAAEVSHAVTEVNRLMREALDHAKGESTVEARSLRYSTTPVYDRERTRVEPMAWQVTQVLELKGKDFEALTDLAGELQEKGLAITQIQFSVSPEAGAAMREELRDEAILQWQRVALRMGVAIGASHLLPTELTLHDDGHFGPQPMFEAAMMDRALASGPALEAGRSTVRVTVSGQARAHGATVLHTGDGI